MADPWQEITEGEMQRLAENAYMFRRTLTKEFGYLCTQLGYTGTIADDPVMECYARAVDRVEWFCPAMSIPEFDALEIEDVGVNPEVDPQRVEHPAAVADALNEPEVGDGEIGEDEFNERRE